MKRAFAVTIILILSCLAVWAAEEEKVFEKIAFELTDGKQGLKKGTVAVIPFEAIGFSESSYGVYVADRISAALSRQGKLTLAERQMLSSILGEKELSMLGIVEGKDAVKIGSLMAVHAIISGRVYRTETGAEISVRLVDSQTGRIITIINQRYPYASKIRSKKAEPWYVGTWKVVTTAPYLREKDMKYETLMLRSDHSFSLFLVNNDGRDVEIRGTYLVERNNIDYRAQKMLFDGTRTAFKRLSRKLEGTIYLEKGKLYFNYTSMDRVKRKRLDAKSVRYRCVAERVK